MNHLRLAIVTPRYWPQVAEPERFVSSLAEEFLRQGAQPRVVTAKWSADWPPEVLHRGIPVERLPVSPRGGWSTLRYMRELSRWLRRHHHEFDLAYVANLRQDAYAGIGALRDSRAAVVCRPRSGGPGGDCRWQQTARFGRRIRSRCYTADAILVGDQTSKQELLDAGYPAARLHQISYGSTSPPVRSSPLRFQARSALSEVNHDLRTADYAPVAICLERLEDHHGLFDLVLAWRTIAERWPSAKLWMIGDGPLREALYERILDLGLHHQILIPGSFDDLEEVFLAADVYVAPSSTPGTSPSLLAAMMAGLPVVAVSTPDTTDSIADGVNGLLIPDHSRCDLSGAISRLFEAPALATRMGDAARRRAAGRYSLDRIAAKHLELFYELVAAQKRGSV